LSPSFLQRVKSEIYFAKKDYKNALKAIDKAIEAKDLDYYKIMKSSILCNLGKYDLIIDAFESLFQSHPNNTALLRALCVAHYHLKNYENALGYGGRHLAVLDALPATGRAPVAGDVTGKRGRDIVAFSLWGKNPIYTNGAVLNCILTRVLLPKWTPRFYVDTTVTKACLNLIRKYGGEVVQASKRFADVPPSFWRFLAADDDKVGYFICRDADSRLSVKEVNAIAQWLNSQKPFHVIRDHIFHCEPMLAGLWGGHAGLGLDMSGRLAAFSARDSFVNAYGNDQKFLREMVWPDIKHLTLVHDRFYQTQGMQSMDMSAGWTEKSHLGRCLTDKKAVMAEAKYFGFALK
jgi:hypothetical protein